MKLAAIAKLIKADEYCKLYKVIYDVGSNYDLYIGTKTAIFPLTGFPKAQNESELATLLGISKKECFCLGTAHHEKLPAGSAGMRKRPGKGGRDGGKNALCGSDY